MNKLEAIAGQLIEAEDCLDREKERLQNLKGLEKPLGEDRELTAISLRLICLHDALNELSRNIDSLETLVNARNGKIAKELAKQAVELKNAGAPDEEGVKEWATRIADSVSGIND